MGLKLFNKEIRVNFVTEPKPGWVLRWIAESYSRYIPNSSVSTEPSPKADVNIYVNYVLFEKKTGIDIGYFTHKEKKDIVLQEKFDEAAKRCDFCIAMCDKTLSLLPKNKSKVVLVPPDPQFLKDKIIFGVVGKEKASGRKRYDWVKRLREIERVEIRMTEGRYKWEDLPNFYREIDYLLILSDNEGGPLPLVEALAMGKPVITSDVGFAKEYTTIIYKDIDDLVKLINKLIIKKDAWINSSREIYEICKGLVEKKK